MIVYRHRIVFEVKTHQPPDGTSAFVGASNYFSDGEDARVPATCMLFTRSSWAENEQPPEVDHSRFVRIDIATFSTRDRYLNQDGTIDRTDLDDWLTGDAQNEPILSGDSNLDGVVDALDLNAVGTHWLQTDAGWCGGDFSADGVVDA